MAHLTSSIDRTPVSQLFEDISQTKCLDPSHNSLNNYLCLDKGCNTTIMCKECIYEQFNLDINHNVIDLSLASKLMNLHHNFTMSSTRSKTRIKSLADETLDYLADRLAKYIKKTLKSFLWKEHKDLMNIIFHVPQKTQIDSIYQTSLALSERLLKEQPNQSIFSGLNTITDYMNKLIEQNKALDDCVKKRREEKL